MLAFCNEAKKEAKRTISKASISSGSFCSNLAFVEQVREMQKYSLTLVEFLMLYSATFKKYLNTLSFMYFAVK